MSGDPVRQRRPRYPGKYPRRFEQRYKELQGDPETLGKVLSAGKTPAGSHVPVLLRETLDVLRPKPGDVVVDCTLGRGGHTRALLKAIQPGGRLLALDADPLELPRTEASLRAEGWSPGCFQATRSNFAGLTAALVDWGCPHVDVLLADLGVSSMQLDDPVRGFTSKFEGPLDMRLNPLRGITAAEWIARTPAHRMALCFQENADEPRASELAFALAGKMFSTTSELSRSIRAALPNRPAEEVEKSIRRVFQSVRIAVNEEFSALDALLRQIPGCLKPGGRAALISFHSGEDRRVKVAFQSGLREGHYAEVARDVVRASPSERRSNPRSTPAKLRWAMAPSVQSLPSDPEAGNAPSSRFTPGH